TANRMIDTTNSALDQRPETFDGIRVNFANDVDAFAVIDSLVCVSASVKAVVGAESVGEDNRLREYVFFDESAQRVGFNIGSDERPDLSLALHHANNRSFGSSTATRAFSLAPIVGFVHFDLAPESADRPALFVGQHGANLFEHAPRRLVGDSGFALNLLCGDTATGLGHEVDRIEPNRKRGGRFMEDRVCGRMNVMAAMIARIGWTADNAVMLCNRVARLTKDAVWVQVVAEPFKAGRIVWELFLEVFQRVRQHVRFAVVVGHDGVPTYVYA